MVDVDVVGAVRSTLGSKGELSTNVGIATDYHLCVVNLVLAPATTLWKERCDILKVEARSGYRDFKTSLGKIGSGCAGVLTRVVARYPVGSCGNLVCESNINQ